MGAGTGKLDVKISGAVMGALFANGCLLAFLLVSPEISGLFSVFLD